MNEKYIIPISILFLVSIIAIAPEVLALNVNEKVELSLEFDHMNMNYFTEKFEKDIEKEAKKQFKKIGNYGYMLEYSAKYGNGKMYLDLKPTITGTTELSQLEVSVFHDTMLLTLKDVIEKNLPKTDIKWKLNFSWGVFNFEN